MVTQIRRPRCLDPTKPLLTFETLRQPSATHSRGFGSFTVSFHGPHSRGQDAAFVDAVPARDVQSITILSAENDVAEPCLFGPANNEVYSTRLIQHLQSQCGRNIGFVPQYQPSFRLRWTSADR